MGLASPRQFIVETLCDHFRFSRLDVRHGSVKCRARLTSGVCSHSRLGCNPVVLQHMLGEHPSQVHPRLIQKPFVVPVNVFLTPVYIKTEERAHRTLYLFLNVPTFTVVTSNSTCFAAQSSEGAWSRVSLHGDECEESTRKTGGPRTQSPWLQHVHWRSGRRLTREECLHESMRW